jgi:hypothetical protein
MPVIGSKMKERQMDTLQHIVTKHIEDPSLKEVAAKNDFAITTTERGISHWEHGHLIAALDTLNIYQKDRRAKSKVHVVGHRMGMSRTYKDDPRTRCVELLKRWLRNNAANANTSEDEVRRMSGLCRDIMNHPTMFPSRNPRSFMNTIAEVYQHLDVQLREVLEKDRTCAELAQRVLSLSRNLVSDAIGYLLLGPTDLKKTDELPSVEVVSLWASLPSESHPLPGRIDAKMQRIMKDVWLTHCGTLIASLLRSRWCVSLFEGAGAQEEASLTPCHAVSTLDIAVLIREVKADFDGTSLKNSGLAGSFRKAQQHGVRMDYLSAVQMLVDLTYLIGEALVQFHRISDGLGDYGMIRVADWLHPFLEALSEKVSRLKNHLENLKRAVDGIAVASAKGYTVEKPMASQRMGQRASLAIERSIVHSNCHAEALLKAVEELRQRSSPDRLPQVVAGIGDACHQLDAVLCSQEFRACVGDRFPTLPRIADVALGQAPSSIEFDVGSRLAIEDVTEAESTLAATPRSSGHQANVQSLRQAASTPRSTRGPEDTAAETTTPRSRIGTATPRSRGGTTTPRSREAPCTQLPNMSFQLPIEPTNPFEDEVRYSSHVAAHPDKVHCDRTQWPLGVKRSEPNSEPVSISALRGKPEDALPLRATVFRLAASACGPGYRRHDRRDLRLEQGRLDIFQKSSSVNVKTSLDVRCDVEECTLLHGSKRLSLIIRRLPPGAEFDSGVWTAKAYLFEFGSADTAVSFHNEIRRLLQL